MPSLAEWLKMLPGAQEQGASAFKAGATNRDVDVKEQGDTLRTNQTNATSIANKNAEIQAAKDARKSELANLLILQNRFPGAAISTPGYGIHPKDDTEQKRINRALRAVNIQGFDVTDPDRMPTSKDAEEAKKQHALARGMDTDLIGISKDLSEANLLDRVSLATIPLTARARNINQGLQNAMMNAKEISKLGVPNKKDLEIVTGQIGDVGSLRSLFSPKETLQDSLNRARERTSRELINATTARGYTALPGTIPYTTPAKPTTQPPPISEDEFITNYLAKKKSGK